MANKIGLEAVLEMAGFNRGMQQYTSGISSMEGTTEKAGGKLSKLGSAIGSMGKMALGVGVAGVTALAGGMVAYVSSAIKAAAETEGVRNTFDRLTESIGGTSEAFIVDLRDATRGMVKDSDLMQAANKFMAMGLADSTEEASKLSEMATQLGMAMGEDATSSMENFALMLANQSIPRLDSFGISSGRVRERIEELMKADEGLTREQAFMTAVMEEGTKTMERVGEQGDTAAANMARLDATMANLKEGVGRAFLPIWNKLLEGLSKFVNQIAPQIQAAFETISRWITDRLVPAIQTVVGWIRDNLIPVFQAVANWFRGEGSESMSGFVDKIMAFLAPAIEFARGLFEQMVGWVQENWPLIQQTVQTVMTAIKNIITTVLGAIRQFWDDHGQQIMAVAEHVWNVIKTVITTVITTIQGIIKAIMQMINGDWEGAWETIKGVAERLWENIKTIIWENIQAIWGAISIVWDTIQPKLKEAWEGIKTKVEEIWEGIKAKIAEVWDTITSKVQTAVDVVVGAVKTAHDKLKEWINKIRGFFDSISGAIQGVIDVIGGFISKFLELIGLEIPSWLKGGSPPPLANWMADIAGATAAAGSQLSAFGQVPTFGSPGMAGAGAGAGTGQTVNVQFGATTINSGMDQATFEARVELAVARAVRGI